MNILHSGYVFVRPAIVRVAFSVASSRNHPPMPASLASSTASSDHESDGGDSFTTIASNLRGPVSTQAGFTLAPVLQARLSFAADREDVEQAGSVIYPDDSISRVGQNQTALHAASGCVSLSSLGAHDVSNLLHSIDLGKYADAFSQLPWRGADLESADERDLEDAGVRAAVHRKSLLRQVEEWRVGGVPLHCIRPKDHIDLEHLERRVIPRSDLTLPGESWCGERSLQLHLPSPSTPQLLVCAGAAARGGDGACGGAGVCGGGGACGGGSSTVTIMLASQQGSLATSSVSGASSSALSPPGLVASATALGVSIGAAAPSPLEDNTPHAPDADAATSADLSEPLAGSCDDGDGSCLLTPHAHRPLADLDGAALTAIEEARRAAAASTEAAGRVAAAAEASTEAAEIEARWQAEAEAAALRIALTEARAQCARAKLSVRRSEASLFHVSQHAIRAVADRHALAFLCIVALCFCAVFALALASRGARAVGVSGRDAEAQCAAACSAAASLPPLATATRALRALRGSVSHGAAAAMRSLLQPDSMVAVGLVGGARPRRGGGDPYCTDD